ncbi:MAG: GNAT family N-acetyltransferase [Bacteriovoracia bacterium]
MALPIFQTDRLILKPVELKDAAAYEKHFVDYEVIQHLSSAVPWPYPKDGVKYFLEKIILPQQGKDRWVWGIFLKENPDELIGCVDLWREPRPENRGFWLGKKFWGKGIMTEAVKPIMDYAFEQLGFEKMILSNAVGNSKSRRVKEKTGCRFIGTRPAAFVRPDYKETELWEITKEDWQQQNGKKNES